MPHLNKQWLVPVRASVLTRMILDSTARRVVVVNAM